MCRLATWPTNGSRLQIHEWRSDSLYVIDSLPSLDTVTIAPGLGSAMFDLTAELTVDQARIITVKIPAPATLSLLAVVPIGLTRRRRTS